MRRAANGDEDVTRAHLATVASEARRDDITAADTRERPESVAKTDGADFHARNVHFRAYPQWGRANAGTPGADVTTQIACGVSSGQKSGSTAVFARNIAMGCGDMQKHPPSSSPRGFTPRLRDSRIVAHRRCKPRGKLGGVESVAAGHHSKTS